MSDTDGLIKARYSHVGLCVSEIERSKAFYQQALGFIEGAVVDSGNEVKKLLGLDCDISMRSQMMVLDNFVIELIYFTEPEVSSEAKLRAINQTGLTHLSFIVDDVDLAAKHLVNCGGSLLASTRTRIEFPGSDPTELVFCTDPDGTRIELYKPSSSWQH